MTTPTTPDAAELDAAEAAAVERFRKTIEEKFSKLSPEQQRARAERLMIRLLGTAPVIVPHSTRQ